MATLIERTSIIRLVTGMFNAAPGATYLSELVTFFDASGGTSAQKLAAIATALGNTNAYKALNPTFQVASEFASNFLTPLGLQANAEAVDFITAKFNAGLPKGQIAYEAITALAASTAPAFDAARAILANKTAVGEYFSVTKQIAQTDVTQLRSVVANVTADPASVTAANTAIDNGAGSTGSGSGGSVFALTTGSNTFTGTAGNDTFDAGLSTGSLQTLNSGDKLDGGAGTDELIAVVNSSVTPSLLTSIENVSVTVVSNSAAVDFSNATGLVSVSSAGSSGAGNTATLSGLGKAVSVSIRDTSMAHTISFKDVTGTADAATVNVSNMSQVSAVVTSILGVETLTLNATGNGSSTATTGIGNLLATQTTKLVVTGDKALNIVDNLEANVLTVDASANTGGVNLDFNATNATVTGGAGNDDFSFEVAGNVSVTAGAGNDNIRFDAAGTYTTADTVAGGDGTDMLSATAAELVTASNATPTTYRTTGIEKLSLNTALANAATVNAANIDTSITRIEITTVSGTDTGAETYVFNAGASTLELDALISGGGDQVVSVGGAALTDTLTIVNGTTSATDVLNGRVLTATGFETVTINTTGTGAAGAQTVGAIGITASTGGTPTLAITGSNQLTMGVITAASGIIDASGMTASGVGLVMTAGSNTATKITGSGANDTLHGNTGTTAAQTIDGGAGNDSITAGAGNDVLTGGVGDDTLEGGAGNDNIDGGAGNDRVVITANANLTVADTIVGGDGTDTLAFTAAITDTAATLQAISGFEVFDFAAGASSSLAMSNFISNQGFTRIDFGDFAGGTGATTNVALAVTDVRLLAGTIGDQLTFSRLIDNSTNSLAISSRGVITTAITKITIADEETVTISGSSAANDLLITDLTAGDLTTLIITGAGDVTVTNAISSTLIATVDASASTGANQILAGNSVVKMTVTAGSGGLTFTGGALADSITGGSAVDILVGGSGADTINSGAASDSVTGGLGADVINVGSGNDRLILTADGESAATGFATSGNATSVALTGADVVTGMGASDIIDVTGVGYTTVGSIASGTLLATADLDMAAITDNTFVLQRGSWIADTTVGSGTFISNASGADTLFIVDQDQATGAVSFHAIVLVGTAGVTGTAAGDGDITLALI